MKKGFIFILIICIALIATCGFAACKKGEEGVQPIHLDAVNAETITYDGDMLRWSPINNAECYYVYLNDDVNYYTVIEPELTIKLSEDVTFSILSVAFSSNYLPAETKTTVSYKYLPMIQSISVKQREVDKTILNTQETDKTAFDYFTFEAVEGADGYELVENGGESVFWKPDINEGVLSQPIGAKFGSAGGFASLTVRPVGPQGERYYSHWSETKKVQVLEDPKNFKYTYEANMISWAPIEGVTEYLVKVGTDLDEIEDYETQDLNYYIYSSDEANFKIEVKAVGNYNKDIVDSRVVTRSFTQLPALSGLTVEYGKLKWTPVATASAYELRLSRTRVNEEGVVYSESLVETTVETNYYDNVLQAAYDTVKENGHDVKKPCTYTCYVRPVIASKESEDIVSYASWSQLSFDLVDSPVLEYRGNNTFAFQPVDSAQSYQYFIDYQDCELEQFSGGVNVSTKIIDAGNELQFAYDFDKKAGVYRVTIAALASNENSNLGSYSSAKSEPFYIVTLGAPQKYMVIDNDYNRELEITQTKITQDGVSFYFNSVYGADYYEYSNSYYSTFSDKDGDGKPDIEGDGLSGGTTIIEDDPVKYTEMINDSENFGVKYDHVFTVNSVIETADGSVNYYYLSAKTSLDHKYVKVDENLKFILDENTNKPQEDTEKKSNVVLMNNTAERTAIQVVRLAGPKNLTLNSAKSEVEFDVAARASGYVIRVVCNSNPEYSFSKKLESNYFNVDFAYPGQYTISVQALGNSNTYVNSMFVGDLQIIKLPSVTDIEVVEDVNVGATFLKWKYDPFTINDREYYPTGYDIYVGNTVITEVKENGSLNNKLDLTGYKQYFSTLGTTCTIVAKGEYDELNNVSIVNATKGTSITIFKLAAPNSVTVSPSSLSWGGSSNATEYRISNGDNYITTVNGTTFEFTRDALSIHDYEEHTFSFKVRAARSDYANDYYNVIDNSARSFFIDSDDSVPVVITLLAAPEVTVDQQTGNLSFVCDEGAASYLVKVKELNGEKREYNYNLEAIAGKKVNFTPTILSGDGSQISISVTAIGDMMETINSFPFVYTTEVRKLDALPADASGKVFDIKHVDTDDDGLIDAFEISIYDATLGNDSTKGQGYYINVGGVNVFTKDGKYTLTSLSAGTYDIKVAAAGGNYTAKVGDLTNDNTLYITSDYSAVQRVYVLAAPMARNVYVTSNNGQASDERTVMFDQVYKAKGYKLTYTYKKYKTAVNIDDPIEFEIVQPAQTIEFTVADGNKENAYTQNEYMCFKLTGITKNIDVVDMVITVIGDEIESISNASSVIAYDVR